MGTRLGTLVDAIDMAARFKEDYARSWETHKKKGQIAPSLKFKKVLSNFRISHKPPLRPPGMIRPPLP